MTKPNLTPTNEADKVELLTLSFRQLGLRAFAVFAARMARAVAVARVLGPEQFGLFGLSIAAVRGLQRFAQFGVKQLIIERGSADNRFLQCAWGFSLACGGVVAALIVACAPLVSALLGSAATLPLLRWGALIPILEGAINPGLYVSERRLTFGRVAWFEVSAVYISLFATVALAVVFRSAVALAIGEVIGGALRVVLSIWLFENPGPPMFSLDATQELLRKGRHFVVVALAAFVMVEGDNLVVGRLAGPAALGYYMVAYTLAAYPLSFLTETINRSLIPAAAAWLRAEQFNVKVLSLVLRWEAWLLVPWAVVLVALGEAIVSLLYGAEKWGGAVPVLAALSLLVLVRGAGNVLSSFLIARGAFCFLSKVASMEAAILLCLVIIGTLTLGAVGAAIAVGVGHAITLLIRLRYVAGDLGVAQGELLGGTRVPAAQGLVALAVAGAAGWVVPGGPLFRLVAGGMVVMGVTIGAMWFFCREDFRFLGGVFRLSGN